MFYFSKIFLLITALLLTSCAEQNIEELPPHILNKQEMANVLVDVHLLESSLNLNLLNNLKITDSIQKPTFEIFEKNNTSKKQYEESFTYYSSHLEDFKEIYDLVLEDINKKQTALQSTKPSK